MPSSTNVTNLKINELTEAQYDTAVQQGIIGANELSVLTDAEAGQVIQVATMPTAGAGELDKIYQFIGTTDANYTNGYFYKCVSDGQDPATYSWTQTDVQPQAGGLPSQTGQSGKFLTTDGTDALWSDKPLVNKSAQTGSLAIQGVANGSQSTSVGVSSNASGTHSVAVGYYAVGGGSNSTVCGDNAYAAEQGTAIGCNSKGGNYGQLGAVAVGYNAQATVRNAIQLGTGTNSTANTFKVGNQNGNFELMSADGTIPADRLTNAINKYSTMPTAAAANVGWIVQFTGTTDSTYTHGYIYECKAQGTTPETYAWEAVEVQAGGGGGLPSQTGNTGKFLTTDGTDASWSDKPLVNTATGFNTIAVRSQSLGIGIQNAIAIGVLTNVKTQCVAIGYSATAIDGINAVAIGFQANCARFGVAIGPDAKTTKSSAIQLGTGTNSTESTFNVGLSSSNNYCLLNADGTIPTDRFTTTPVADGTYVPTLTISSGVATRSWAAPSGGGSTALSLTLAAANWSNNSITVTATGVTASNNVIVSPAPASQSAYTTAGVMCTAQAADSLTFTCTTTPSADLTVTVLII